MHSTSESLLARLKTADDPDAWSRFVQLYTPLIFYWARRTGLQPQDAADLVQDVMTIVFQQMPEFCYDARRSFRAWLRTITLNKHREHARKKKLNVIGVTQSELGNIPESADATWDQDYARELVSSAMRLMRGQFAPQTWAALEQVMTTKRPASEVAQEMGISVWTIYSAKSRLMRRLRSELGDLLD